MGSRTLRLATECSRLKFKVHCSLFAGTDCRRHFAWAFAFGGNRKSRDHNSRFTFSDCRITDWQTQ